EYQALVQRALQRLNEEARTYALAPEPPTALSTDQGLVQWLQELNVDSGTIQMGRDGMPHLEGHLGTASRIHTSHPWTLRAE
ncbi:MAP3K6 isoform 1, partial [Pan troglodytes]